MATSKNKSKSSGLRMLWIPGRAKHHPKGRLDTTNKQINYPTRQKKSEVWSLGGSEAQKDLIYAEPNSVLEGEAGSSAQSLKCAIGAVSQCTQTTLTLRNDTDDDDGVITIEKPFKEFNRQIKELPDTPNNLLVAPLVLLPQTPDGDLIMPAKTTVNTHVTTAEISDENRFAILANPQLDVREAYTQVDDGSNASRNGLNSSAHTNGSNETAFVITSTDPKNMERISSSSSATSSPKKKKKHHRHNHNDDHDQDTDSISTLKKKLCNSIPNDDFKWVDDIESVNLEDESQPAVNVKKKSEYGPNTDQHDGVPSKTESDNIPKTEDEDDKLVKCLYFTLMCCECNIS